MGTWRAGPIGLTFGSDGSLTTAMPAGHDLAGRWSVDGGGQLHAQIAGRDLTGEAWVSRHYAHDQGRQRRPPVPAGLIGPRSGPERPKPADADHDADQEHGVAQEPGPQAALGFGYLARGVDQHQVVHAREGDEDPEHEPDRLQV